MTTMYVREFIYTAYCCFALKRKIENRVTTIMYAIDGEQSQSGGWEAIREAAAMVDVEHKDGNHRE